MSCDSITCQFGLVKSVKWTEMDIEVGFEKYFGAGKQCHARAECDKYFFTAKHLFIKKIYFISA